MVGKRREIKINAPGNSGDIIISVELDGPVEAEITSYDIDAEKLFQVLWGGVPSGTVERLFLKLAKAYETRDWKLSRWESFKRKQGWIR